MDSADRRGVAERIRALIGSIDDNTLSLMARQLDVEELALRLSVDEVSPYPTVDVLLAVIRRFGLDPTWLLTGVYDPATHRRTAGDTSDAAAEALRDIARRSSPRLDLPAPDAERPRQAFAD